MRPPIPILLAGRREIVLEELLDLVPDASALLLLLWGTFSRSMDGALLDFYDLISKGLDCLVCVR